MSKRLPSLLPHEGELSFFQDGQTPDGVRFILRTTVSQDELSYLAEQLEKRRGEKSLD